MISLFPFAWASEGGTAGYGWVVVGARVDEASALAPGAVVEANGAEV